MNWRRSEMEKGSTEIKSANEELSMLGKLKLSGDTNPDRADDPNIPTKPFLSLCHLLLQFLDKIGPTMTVMRQDIHQNIQMIERAYETDTSRYSDMVEILKKEAAEGNAKKTNSCSKAFVWLTRCLDFTVALLQKSTKDPGLMTMNMEQAVEASYNLTLKPWHGWISSAAFRIALKLVPDNKTFINLLVAKDESYDTVVEEIRTFTSMLSPFLEEIRSVLRLYSLDQIKAK